jgi:preprotein translocase subunit SecG
MVMVMVMVMVVVMVVVVVVMAEFRGEKCWGRRVGVGRESCMYSQDKAKVLRHVTQHHIWPLHL